jgi:hypothetical protein
MPSLNEPRLDRQGISTGNTPLPSITVATCLPLSANAATANGIISSLAGIANAEAVILSSFEGEAVFPYFQPELEAVQLHWNFTTIA